MAGRYRQKARKDSTAHTQQGYEVKLMSNHYKTGWHYIEISQKGSGEQGESEWVLCQPTRLGNYLPCKEYAKPLTLWQEETSPPLA